MHASCCGLPLYQAGHVLLQDCDTSYLICLFVGSLLAISVPDLYHYVMMVKGGDPVPFTMTKGAYKGWDESVIDKDIGFLELYRFVTGHHFCHQMVCQDIKAFCVYIVCMCENVTGTVGGIADPMFSTFFLMYTFGLCPGAVAKA